jgi:hypothetical protein
VKNSFREVRSKIDRSLGGGSDGLSGSISVNTSYLAKIRNAIPMPNILPQSIKVLGAHDTFSGRKGGELVCGDENPIMSTSNGAATSVHPTVSASKVHKYHGT